MVPPRKWNIILGWQERTSQVMRRHEGLKYELPSERNLFKEAPRGVTRNKWLWLRWKCRDNRGPEHVSIRGRDRRTTGHRESTEPVCAHHMEELLCSFLKAHGVHPKGNYWLSDAWHVRTSSLMGTVQTYQWGREVQNGGRLFTHEKQSVLST